jgi:DNA-binding winged helix-turn-helix (wHTH) protein/Tol biopolymer transport system component
MKSLITNNFRFSEFELDGTKRLLFKEGKTVSLNPKTFDLLELLVARRGEVLSKDELLETIWEGQFVEESNLTVHISTLRKTLGEVRGENRFILTVPGKGYKFIGEESEVENEYTFESHEISRVLIAEEIEEVENKQLKLKSPSRHFSYFYLLPFTFLLFFGGYFWLRNDNQKSVVPFAKMQIRQLTNNGKVEIAALSPDGKLFAYVTDDFGKKTLWLGQTDGGKNIQLRPPTETIYNSLAFSPDNDKLYFLIRDENNENPTLFRMPVFGGATEKIHDNINNFALSHNGKQIAFAKFDYVAKQNLLVVNDLNTGSEREILSPYPVPYPSVSFSSDGKTLAFSGITDQDNHNAFTAQISSLILTAREARVWSGVPQFHVWNIDIPSGEANQITTDLSSYHGALSLSGSALLTIEHRQMENIWVAPADNLSDAKQITFGSFGRYDGLWGLGWTPDNRLIYDSSNTQSQIISVMDDDGSNQKELTSPGFVDSALVVSRDGRYVVFHSTRSGGFDIWRMDINGDHPTQLTFGKENYQPTISPDGLFVYYKSTETGIGELRRISIDGGESVALTEKETSWSCVSPDGQYMAAINKRHLEIFPISGGEPIKLFDLPKSATAFGGIRWMPDGKAIVYYDINYGYWKQSIEGGEPTRIENLPKERLYNFAWSNDGKQFAFVRGQEIRDVVLWSEVLAPLQSNSK